MIEALAVCWDAKLTRLGLAILFFTGNRLPDDSWSVAGRASLDRLLRLAYARRVSSGGDTGLVVTGEVGRAPECCRMGDSTGISIGLQIGDI